FAYLTMIGLADIYGHETHRFSISVQFAPGASGFLVGSAVFKAVEALHCSAWWVRFPSAPVTSCGLQIGPDPYYSQMRTILLLTGSNLFMTIAWYGHLRYKSSALWKVILISWGIAFFEYCLQVPANRWGHG